MSCIVHITCVNAIVVRCQTLKDDFPVVICEVHVGIVRVEQERLSVFGPSNGGSMIRRVSITGDFKIS